MCPFFYAASADVFLQQSFVILTLFYFHKSMETPGNAWGWSAFFAHGFQWHIFFLGGRGVFIMNKRCAAIDFP